jgi:hypothetical protein
MADHGLDGPDHISADAEQRAAACINALAEIGATVFFEVRLLT